MSVADEVLAYVRVLIWPFLVFSVVAVLRSNIVAGLDRLTALLERESVETEGRLSVGGNELSLRIAAVAEQQQESLAQLGVSPDKYPPEEPALAEVAATAPSIPVTLGASPMDRIATVWDSVVAAIARLTVLHPEVVVSGRTGSTANAMALQSILPSNVASSVQVLDNIYEQVIRSRSQVNNAAADAFVSLANQTLARLANL